MKIYTKTGDRGETSLFRGGRIKKDSPRVEAYGAVDELSAFIGLARAFNKDEKIELILKTVQHDLHVLGADLATPEDIKASKPILRVSLTHVNSLERMIDDLQKELTPTRKFILPGGSPTASHLHVARAVCRRAERRVVTLSQKEAINGQVVVYLNRLSDLLYVLARFANRLAGVPEHQWRG